MRIAYYVALHARPYQAKLLFDSIYNDEDLFLVHIDKKCDANLRRELLAVVPQGQNVIICKSRNVNWGSWSQVAAELSAMSLAVASPIDWQYFINVSGQDLPIKSDHERRALLAESGSLNFIRVWPFERVRRLDGADPHLAPSLRTLPFRPFKRGLSVEFKGAQWHMLTRAFCTWVLTDPVSRQLQRYLRFQYCPDETFFQNAIMNGPFQDQLADDCQRLFFFPGPRIITVADLPAIHASDAHFARKFDAQVDGDVIRELMALI